MKLGRPECVVAMRTGGGLTETVMRRVASICWMKSPRENGVIVIGLKLSALLLAFFIDAAGFFIAVFAVFFFSAMADFRKGRAAPV